jgi:hypothetical protein
MSTIRFTTEIGNDQLIRPPEGVFLGPGKAEITIVPIAAATTNESKPPRSSLADWAEQEAEHWGSAVNSADVASFNGRSF